MSKLNDNTVISGSAVLDKQLSNFALENSITGLEFLYCIPGSIGGAIRMNAGCYGYDISKSIASIQAVDRNGIVRTISSEKINFYYRGSNLPNDLIFLSGTFAGKKQDINRIKEKMEKLLADKKKNSTI